MLEGLGRARRRAHPAATSRLSVGLVRHPLEESGIFTSATPPPRPSQGLTRKSGVESRLQPIIAKLWHLSHSSISMDQFLRAIGSRSENQQEFRSIGEK